MVGVVVVVARARARPRRAAASSIPDADLQLELVLYPHPALRAANRDVAEDEYSAVATLARRMFDVMYRGRVDTVSVVLVLLRASRGSAVQRCKKYRKRSSSLRVRSIAPRKIHAAPPRRRRDPSADDPRGKVRFPGRPP